MSLHVRMLNACHTHPSTCNVYIHTRASLLTVSPLQHPTTKHMRAQLPQFTPLAAPQPAPLQHGPMRALRDTGDTCHGSPDLGEGSSRAHTCTTCPWNAKRRRQDYGCTCMCGDSRGCPTSSGDKQATRGTHRVHAEL